MRRLTTILSITMSLVEISTAENINPVGLCCIEPHPGRPNMRQRGEGCAMSYVAASAIRCRCPEARFHRRAFAPLQKKKPLQCGPEIDFLQAQ